MPQDAPEVDVRYVAELARLELTEDEMTALQHDISEIVGYVKQLQEVDVDDVEPTAHAIQMNNVTRKDEARDGIDRELFLDNAPDVLHDELLKVPVVLGGDEGGA